MTTQYISFSEARKNLSQLWKKAQSEKIRYRVLLHSRPVFDITSVLEANIKDNELSNFSALSEKSFDFWEGDEDDIFINCDAIR